MQRTLAIALLFALALVTGGCVQAVTGDTVTFEASPASVSDSVASDHNYRLDTRDTVRVTNTVDLPALGETDVRLTNHLVAYSRTDVQGEDAAENSAGAFLVVSTPKAEVAGQGTNPLGGVPTKQLVERFASRSGDQRDVEQVGSETIRMLDSTTEATKFSSTTRVNGQSVETFVYVARVAHGSDYVIAVAVIPRPFEDDEGAVYELMRAIGHDDGD